MAILTWKNIPTPDIGASQQQGIRTAGDLLNRAVGNASAGVGEFQKIQAAEKAAQVQAADKFMLEKMLSAQTPEQLQAMQGDGSLMGSPAAGLASPETLLMADARKDLLQKRSDQDFDRVWNRDEMAYNRDRTRTQNVGQDALAGLMDAASARAVKDLPGALEMVKNSNASLKDKTEAYRVLDLLHKEPDRAAQARDREEKMQREVARGIAEYRAQATDAGKAEVLAKLRAKDPKLALDVEDGVHRRGGDAQNMAGSNPLADANSTEELKEYTRHIEDGQRKFNDELGRERTGVKVILNTRDRAGETPHVAALNAAERIKKVAGKEVDAAAIGELTRKIRDLHKKMDGAATPAEISEMILNNLEEDTALNLQDFMKGLDLDDGDLRTMRDNVQNDRKRAKRYEQRERDIKQDTLLAEKLKKVDEKVASARVKDLRAPGESNDVEKFQKEQTALQKQIRTRLERRREQDAEEEKQIAEKVEKGLGSGVTPEFTTQEQLMIMGGVPPALVLRNRSKGKKVDVSPLSPILSPNRKPEDIDLQ